MCQPKYLIIFDCDGVLVDSEKISQEVWVDFLNKYDIKLNPREFQRRYIGLDGVRVKLLVEKEFNIVLPEDFLDNVKKKKKEIYKKRLTLIKGVSNCLNLLDDYIMCVASANSVDTLRYIMELVGISHFFGDNLFSAELVEKGKPAPDLFLYISNKFSINPNNCIVIEDTVNGINAGKSANMQVLGFVGGSHCDEDYIERLKSSNPIGFLSEMRELPEKIIEITTCKEL